jgi:RNA polymerase sigma factor (sigma-70 family)
MTPDMAFEEVWPELCARLRRALSARRVPAHVIDDLIQETGLRLFKRWENVDPTTIWALTNTIALNLIRDEMRKEEVRRRESNKVSRDNVRTLDEDVLSRLELKRVEKALLKLSDADRQVLLAEWGGRVASVSPAALKMARMRARRRLRAVLENVSALLPIPWRLRRAVAESQPSVPPLLAQLTNIAVAGLVAIGGPVALGNAAGSDEPETALAMAGRSRHLDAADRLDVPERESRDRRPDPLATSDRSLGRHAMAGHADPGTEELNENYGPVRSGDDGLHVGEGGNGLGPYGAEKGAKVEPAGQEASAHAEAKYEAPRCDGDVIIGGQSDFRCDGPGDASGSAEADANGQQHEVGTDSRP